MNSINKNISKMLREIKYIRSAIEKNGDNLRQMFYSKSYRIVYWLGGMGIIFFSSILYHFIKKYKRFEQIPVQTQIVLISSGLTFLVLIGLIKLGGFSFLRKKYPGKSIFSLLAKIIGRAMLQIYIIMATLMIYFAIYFIAMNQAYYIFPVTSIGVGILFLILGDQFALSELFLCGLMLIFPSAVSVPFLNQSPESAWLWTGFTFGTTFVFLGTFMELKINRRIKDLRKGEKSVLSKRTK